jgi:hypothetical protein
MQRVIRAVFYVVSAPFLFFLWALIYGLEDLHGLFGAVRRFYTLEGGRIDVELVGYTVIFFVLSFIFWGWVFHAFGKL